MRYRKLLFSTGAAAALAGTLAGGYYWGFNVADKNRNDEETSMGGSYISQEKIQQAYDSSIKPWKFFTLEKEAEWVLSIYGSGTLLEDRSTHDFYVLTVEHITPSDTYKNEDDEEFKVIESRMEVEGLEAKVVKKDDDADLALLKIEIPSGYDTQKFHPYIGKIATELSKKDNLLGVGFPSGEKNYFFAQVEEQNEDSAFIDLKTIKGNSGGGVFHLSGGELRLAGVVSGYLKNKPTGIMCNLRQLRQFFEGTPLEDDYL